MSANQFFSEKELSSIKEAVQETEKEVSGEIVPFYTDKSARYEESYWRVGAVTYLLSFFIIIIIDRIVPVDSILYIYDPLVIALICTVIAAIMVAINHFVPSFQRLVTGKSLLEYHAIQKAETIFLEEEVFNTRQRTGILLFVSLFEHKVIVMGDAGINKVIAQGEWDSVVKLLVEGLKKNNASQGFINGIKKCKEILLEHGFTHSEEDDNFNQLSDELRSR